MRTTMSAGVSISKNSDRVIDMLDADSLREIFEWLAILQPARYNSLGWIIASHVCHTWRNILLGLSSLWGGIVLTFFHKSEARTEVLARARDALLTLWPEIRPEAPRRRVGRASHISVYETGYTHSIAWPNLKRLATLITRETAGPDLDWHPRPRQSLDVLPGQVLPHLEILELFVPGHHTEDARPHIHVSPFVAPRLKEVVYFLTFYPFRADSLRVFRLRLTDGSEVSFKTFLQCLQSCTQLEELVLEWCLEIRPSDSAFLENAILDYPNLKYFKFMGQAATFEALWRRLCFTRLAALDLTLPLNSESVLALSLIQPLLRHRELDALAISRRGPFPLEFCISPRSSISAYAPWLVMATTGAPPIHGAIVRFLQHGPGYRPDDISPRACITTMLQCLARDNITMLDLTDDCHFVADGEFWDIPLVIGTSLPHVHTLVLLPKMISALMKIFFELATSSNAAFLPRLESVAFKYPYEVHASEDMYWKFVNTTLPVWLNGAKSIRGRDSVLSFVQNMRSRSTRDVHFVDPILPDNASPELREYMAQFMASILSSSKLQKTSYP